MSKTAPITGAGSGFGRLAAVQLAGCGHAVIATIETNRQVVELSVTRLELAVAKLDITYSNDVAMVEKWHLDVLIVNAGVCQADPLGSIPMNPLRAVFEVNVFGAFAIARRVAAAMKRKHSGRWRRRRSGSTLPSSTRARSPPVSTTA